MLRFRAIGEGGRQLLGFGLSAENIKRLQAGKPILFDLDQLGFEGVDVTIIAGETEESMKKDLADNGLNI